MNKINKDYNGSPKHQMKAAGSSNSDMDTPLTVNEKMAQKNEEIK